ncbi:unnamed protein product [Rangifer tarandus platyrhynchus]|uniref:Uncharacterized protein n=1 Tax=Rangifer tarandus platyrhynchus TaxID=3082113 RepID=A0AC59YMI4_RANTA
MRAEKLGPREASFLPPRPPVSQLTSRKRLTPASEPSPSAAPPVSERGVQGPPGRPRSSAAAASTGADLREDADWLRCVPRAGVRVEPEQPPPPAVAVRAVRLGALSAPGWERDADPEGWSVAELGQGPSAAAGCSGPTAPRGQ